jgi:hypothetical protein
MVLCLLLKLLSSPSLVALNGAERMVMWLWESVAAFLRNGEAEHCYKFEVYWSLQGRK